MGNGCLEGVVILMLNKCVGLHMFSMYASGVAVSVCVYLNYMSFNYVKNVRECVVS